MQLNRSTAVSLFQAIGLKSADKADSWNLQTMESKIRTFLKQDVPTPDDSDLKEVLESVLASLQRGEKVEVVADPAKSKAAKGGKKAQAKKEEPAPEPEESDEDEEESEEDEEESEEDEEESEEDDEEEDEEEEEAPDKKAGKKGSKAPAAAKNGKAKKAGKGGGSPVGKGPGVIATIAEVVKKASKSKPVTKDDVLKALKAKFPDRDENSMLGTVKTQVPNGLRRRAGLNVMTNDKGGYWIGK